MWTRCCQRKHDAGTVNKPSLRFLITNQMQQQNEPEQAKPKSESSGEERLHREKVLHLTERNTESQCHRCSQELSQGAVS